MKKFSIIAALIVLIAGGAYALMGHKATANASSPNSTATASGQKLADSQYAQYAYLISGDTIAPDAQTALSGFTLSKQAASNGATQYTLTASKAGYHNQTYALQPGQQLYFIETSLGDDRDGQDTALSDDTAIVTDANGVIVSQ